MGKLSHREVKELAELDTMLGLESGKASSGAGLFTVPSCQGSWEVGGEGLPKTGQSRPGPHAVWGRGADRSSSFNLGGQGVARSAENEIRGGRTPREGRVLPQPARTLI